MENEKQDVFKLFEQLNAFMNVSKPDNSTDNNDVSDNFQKMMNMMQMMQVLQNKPNDMTEEKYEPNGIPKTEIPKIDASLLKSTYYDDIIHTPALKSIKSAIPYLETKYQKPLGLFIKMIELQKLMEIYSKEIINSQNTFGGDYKRNMLMAIRPHMDDVKKEKIDSLLKILEMKEITTFMNVIKKG